MVESRQRDESFLQYLLKEYHKKSEDALEDARKFDLIYQIRIEAEQYHKKYGQIYLYSLARKSTFSP